MDFVNKAKDAMKDSSGSTGGGMGMGSGSNTAAAGGQKEDFGDKGLDFLEKKTGHTLNRDQNEKLTDGMRGAYEKQTGKKVNPKFSN